MIFIALFTLLFLMIRLGITTMNFFSKPLLPKNTFNHSIFISILVPARNEEENLPKLFESLEKQTYSNYELIILNDSSEDDTLTIIQEYSKLNHRCKFVNSDPLPNGWIGKNWACHQLSLMAEGKYLFFLDADVVLQNNFFESVLNEIQNKNLALLSVFPDQILETTGEKLVVPLMNYLLLSLLYLKWVYKLPYSSMAAANGQCMVFDKEIYKKHLFHTQVKNFITEDIEIMHLVKKQKLKGAVYLANNLIRCRMYKGFEDSINGFSKNFISGFGNNIFLAVIYVFSLTFFYLSFIFADFDYKNNVIFIVLTMSVIIKIMITKISNQPVLINILLHPFQLIALIIILFKSIYLKLSKKNQWKGRMI